jgi:ABC-type glycerol-3-phosphate transport system substrate-binding protein
MKKKRFGRIVSAALMVGGLTSAATAGTAVASTKAAQSSSNLKGTLTIADWEFLENGVGPQMESVLKAYEKSHPGVKVKFLSVSYDSYVPTLEAQIGAHGGPDLMVLVDSTFADLLRANDLAPITNLPSSDTLRPQNAGAEANGKRYGLIWETVIYDYIYNKKIYAQAGVAKAPTNFNSFLSDCIQIKKKTGLWGYAARNMLNEEEAWYEDFTGTWIDGFGGNWTNTAGKFTIDSPQNIQAVTDFAKVYNSGCMDTGETASVFRGKYEHGQVATLMDNSDAAYTYTFQNPTVTNQDQAVSSLPFPTKHSGDQQLYLSVNKYSKNTALANNFLAWLYSKPVQTQLVSATAPQTTGTPVLPSASFMAAHPWTAPYLNQVANGESLLVAKKPWDTAQLWGIVMPAIARVLAGQATAKQALQQAQSTAVSQLG